MESSRIGSRPLVAACLVVAVVLASSREARAHEVRTVPRAAQCRALVAEGASADSLYRGALCSLQRGDHVEAMNALTRFLEHPDAREERKRAVRAKLVGVVAPKTARLVFDPSDAQVTIDGHDARASGGVLYVHPGEHSIAARTSGAHAELDVELTAGSTRLVVVAPPPPPPHVDDACSRGAPVPSAEPAAPSAPMPAASIPVMHPLVAASLSAVESDERTRTPPILAIALAGSSLVAASVGTWLLVSSIGDQRDADAKATQAHSAGQSCYGRNNATCASADDLSRSADLERTVAVGVFAGAGALAVSALLTHFLWPRTVPVVRIGAAAAPGAISAGGVVRF